MILDLETFADLAVAIQSASDANLKVAKAAKVISESVNESGACTLQQWNILVDALGDVQEHIIKVENLLKATLDANKAEEALE